MRPDDHRQRNLELKRLLDGTRTVAAPGAYDALSAQLVEEAGFEVVYIGSYGTSASAFGYPDVGLLSLDELVMQAARVAGAVSIPVIADAEGGFHDPASLWRTVRAFEQAGVSAIHLEDHAGGKHTDLPQTLIPLDDMLAKLRAALEARTDPNFQIIARTDAIWAMKDEREAARRVAAYAQLGADLVFPTAASLSFIAELRRQGLRVATIETPHGEPVAQKNGADLVIHYGLCAYAATKAVSEALRVYRETRDPTRLNPLLEDEANFEARSDYAAFSERARRYGKR